MKVEERKEKRNDLLKRTEYDYTFLHPGKATPTKAEVQKLVAEDLGVEAERVEVRKIYSEAGRAATWAKVYVWDEKKVEDLSKKGEEDGKEEEA